MRLRGPKRGFGAGRDSVRHQSESSTASNNTTSQDTGPENVSVLGETTKRMLNTLPWIADNDGGVAPDSVQLLPLKSRAALTASPLDELSPLDCHLLLAIYRAGFDTIFSSRMSRYGCPFLSESGVGEDYNSISDVCKNLDRWMAEMSQHNRQPAWNGSIQEQILEDSFEDESLRCTIAASQRGGYHLPLKLEMRRLHTRASYSRCGAMRDGILSSMLALFLFALTPVPAGISEEEEADGISGQSCIHAALQHIQTLRARQRSLQFNGTRVSQPIKSAEGPPSLELIRATDFITAENIAYWAALTFDTSASLTLNCRPLLSSGLFGFEAELPWRLVRAGATIFQTKLENKQAHGHHNITDEQANQIIASGMAWKLFAWKLTAVFKEALRDGHDESEVQRVFSLVVGAIHQFNTIYRPPLEACQRRMPFLGQHTKLRWYSLMLHYYLSILLLANIIEATDRFDLLADIEEAYADAESVVVNTLMFGLQNTVKLGVKVESKSHDDVGVTQTSIIAPLISIDPYPHHIVAGVQLVQKAADRELARGKISQGAHENLRAVLERTLGHLPQSSKSVKALRDTFSKGLQREGGEPPMPYSV
ncbi:uncharacterized protein P174DRAFT_435788 [Aspergillus novofumigatus IBT 16806]|uniref:C6 transcription factor n=1 Tax=Aspergillus novofumigatus (strain IBT 16806) TaxID=1392255 RepID=A0A2I1BUQ1_ASPN1|nr:uncharacterized protein P174DRAFT_435788 [Aspergillus novofumigatus IBT 16806]PKX89092.1 hypothetical protein P174DRAFT_435788 [Aspergillus novofumigatus IBT 16806]